MINDKNSLRSCLHILEEYVVGLKGIGSDVLFYS